MRLLAGAGRSEDEASTLVAAEGWSRVEAGAWLARALESLRGPDGLAAADPGADLRGTLRPYQKTGVAWLAFASSLRLGFASPTTWGWARRSGCWRSCCCAGAARAWVSRRACWWRG